LINETTIRLDWLWSNALGGIKLCVKAEDDEAATQILNQEIPEGLNIEEDGNYEQPRCPQCQSLEISYEDPDKHLAYASIFIVKDLIPAGQLRWKCNACGNVWPPPNTDSNQTS